MKLPNIADGCMINGIGETDTMEWITEIASMIEIVTGSRTKRAYLAKECRHEKIFPWYGYIFGEIWQSAAIHSWQGGHLMRAGLSRIRFYPFRQGVRNRVMNFQQDNNGRYYQNWRNEVICETVDVEEIPIEKLFADLQERKITNMRRLYILLEFEREEDTIRMLAPAHYLNFSIAPYDEILQPISGNCLYFEDDEFWFSYVSAALKPDKKWHIELNLCKPANILNGLVTGEVSTILKYLSYIPWFGKFFTTDLYSKVRKFEGECKFVLF